jgi:hypothetical protein
MYLCILSIKSYQMSNPEVRTIGNEVGRLPRKIAALAMGVVALGSGTGSALAISAGAAEVRASQPLSIIYGSDKPPLSRGRLPHCGPKGKVNVHDTAKFIGIGDTTGDPERIDTFNIANYGPGTVRVNVGLQVYGNGLGGGVQVELPRCKATTDTMGLEVLRDDDSNAATTAPGALRIFVGKVMPTSTLYQAVGSVPVIPK